MPLDTDALSGPAHSDAPWHRGTAAGQRLIRSAIIVAGALAASPPLMAQGDPRALLVEQGTYWQSLGRADLAEESWRKLLRVDPRSAEALYGMAQVELSRGRAEAARGWTEQLRTLHPNDPRAERLQQQASQPGPPASDLQRARSAAQAGRSAEALALYRAMFANRAVQVPNDLDEIIKAIEVYA